MHKILPVVYIFLYKFWYIWLHVLHIPGKIPSPFSICSLVQRYCRDFVCKALVGYIRESQYMKSRQPRPNRRQSIENTQHLSFWCRCFSVISADQKIHQREKVSRRPTRVIEQVRGFIYTGKQWENAPAEHMHVLYYQKKSMGDVSHFSPGKLLTWSIKCFRSPLYVLLINSQKIRTTEGSDILTLTGSWDSIM